MRNIVIFIVEHLPEHELYMYFRMVMAQYEEIRREIAYEEEL